MSDLPDYTRLITVNVEVPASGNWYDRNPIIVADYTDAVLAPHASAEMCSYTVPADKKAIVELVSITIIRATAASTPSTVYAFCEILWNTTNTETILCAILDEMDNTAGDRDTKNFNGAMLLTEGATINLITADNSTGGTCRYIVGFKITEFDA